MIDLGTIKPQLSLYGIAVEPQLNVLADLFTRATEVNLKLDASASLDRAVLLAKAREIYDKRKNDATKPPLQVQEGACKLEFGDLQSLDLTVRGFTGVLEVAVRVDPEGCGPIWAGIVHVTARFTPHAEKAVLRVKLAALEVKVPGIWQGLASIFGGRDLNAEFAARIRKYFDEEIKYQLPAIEGGRAAFQGASLDFKNGAIVFRVKGDAQIDRAQAASLFQNWPPVKQFSYRVP